MQDIVKAVHSWIIEAGEQIKDNLNKEDLLVETKSGRKDLVTEMDKATQDFLIHKIKTYNPDAKILGEENGLDQLADWSGQVFIIDPIDGTMNFVLEKENFCIMIAIYEEGKGRFGFVYNVMKNEFLWGGPEIGVFNNGKEIQAPKNIALSEGLVGLNSPMLIHNRHHETQVSDRSLGIRMTGCAGFELIALIKGQRAAYISHLAPWDYAPGGVLLETLGLKMANIAGEPLTLSGRELFVGGTPKAFDELMDLMNQ
ncbi:inositol monophosphatase family protein [Enterococcus sp. DIV0876]|uniref:inositol monophosphatase family protein n=1 Tax=Enterococcus sp. DIV0876 TaxID=2774633 RepID=UPI003D2FD74C